ncbi:uncharacterized protein LOC111867214 [Cryptotermes secundus]|uniref:uncharacterized protein LOC111867214 n=1 Tax=Cryptotermes secundus TaxID=105785 RepID=UPI000CD7DC84|nr:uncharacterized protein LOC111867214 [Cryptotermes secundus]
MSTPKKKTSADPLARSHKSLSSVSPISTSTTGSDSVSSKGKLFKKVTVSQDDVEYTFNMYLLALATTKLQEKALSEVTAENENQKLSLLSEVERSRSHLGALKKRYEEVTYLSQQSELLRCKKEELGPLMDLVSDGLKNTDLLKNALDTGLPVKGFKAESNACSLKNTLCDSSKALEKTWGATCEHGALYDKTGQEVADILSTLTSIAEAQRRCGASSTALNHEVLKESCLKVMQQRNKKL